jgi:hypothetical protein|nr:MAG TPA: hypothetical protein [Caudoviricetes sp.]
MKIIRNKIIPFNGFKAINIFGVLFVRERANIDAKTINHEEIHTAQMKEMLYIFFYLWYIVEWIVRLFYKGNAYKNISLEKEAYSNESDMFYLSNRKKYSWMKYI